MCDYCKDEDDKLDLFEERYHVFDADFTVNGMISSRGRIEVTMLWHDFGLVIAEKIRFCPMCGRKLIKDET